MELNNKEEWRDIQGFEGLYQVSNLGNIKSLPRIKYYVDGRIRHNNEKVISLTHKDGYTEVRLHKPKDVKGRIYKVHILVDGKIIKTGDSSLAETVENNGYSEYIK